MIYLPTSAPPTGSAQDLACAEPGRPALSSARFTPVDHVGVINRKRRTTVTGYQWQQRRGDGPGWAQRLPRFSCSRSMASNSALKLPLPKPSDPCRSISSKNTVGRSPIGRVKICSR